MLFTNYIQPTDRNDPYKELGFAVIFLSLKDYIKALRTNNEKTIQEIEIFFKSDLYYSITDIDGEYLLKLVKQKYYSEKNIENYILTFNDLKEFYHERIY